MELEVKTCGLRDAATLDVAVAAGATHLGFVHFPPSPRSLDMSAIARLIDHARGRARTVVVTVDPDDALVELIANEARPDLLQLHGRETPERVEAVRRFGMRVVKAVPVAGADDLRAARRYAGLAERMLFDAKAPAAARLPGGNGVAFDWSLLREWEGDPFWLAGGLHADNVVEAVNAVRPRGIDLSSGIESAPGCKDADKIRALFERLKTGGIALEHAAAA